MYTWQKHTVNGTWKLNSYSSLCITIADFEFMEVNLFSDFSAEW